jgi:hypothetical protein
VNWGSDGPATRTFEDGLGVRRLETDACDGTPVEVLEVSPTLATHGEIERAIRDRAARLDDAAIEGIARVRRIERRDGALRVVADHVEGLRLPDLLQEALKNNAALPQPAALELAGRILRLVSALHQVPGLSHGAITPSHVVITRTGDVVLTDAVFGAAFEALQRNREQLWREFRLALPASASLPRFDQRADVAQLGATVLAIALGRSLRAAEYPRSIHEVVIAATLAARPGESSTSASALRMWLQEALHLHPRATFASAVDAQKAFDEVLGPSAATRGGAAAFDAAVRRVFGDGPESRAAAELAVAWAEPPAVLHSPQTPPANSMIEPAIAAAAADGSTGAFSSLLRSVLPLFRAS